MSAIMNCR